MYIYDDLHVYIINVQTDGRNMDKQSARLNSREKKCLWLFAESVHSVFLLLYVVVVVVAVVHSVASSFVYRRTSQPEHSVSKAK